MRDVRGALVISNYWRRNFSDLRQTFPKIKGSYLEKLPIPEIYENNILKHNEIVKLTEQILNLIKDQQTETLPERKEQLQTRIEYSEGKIDEIVYGLYGLTEEEIKIVEN